MGGDGGRRDAGGIGEVAAGERALEQRPPLHRLRWWATAGVVVVVTSPHPRMGRPCRAAAAGMEVVAGEEGGGARLLVFPFRT